MTARLHLKKKKKMLFRGLEEEQGGKLCDGRGRSENPEVQGGPLEKRDSQAETYMDGARVGNNTSIQSDPKLQG